MKARASFDSLPPQIQEVIRREADKYSKDAEKQFNAKMEKVIRWLLCELHDRRGFGKKRLLETVNGIYHEWVRAEERYGLDDDMRFGDFCELRLLHLGIDVKQIYDKFEGDK